MVIGPRNKSIKYQSGTTGCNPDSRLSPSVGALPVAARSPEGTGGYPILPESSTETPEENFPPAVCHETPSTQTLQYNDLNHERPVFKSPEAPVIVKTEVDDHDPQEPLPPAIVPLPQNTPLSSFHNYSHHHPSHNILNVNLPEDASSITEDGLFIRTHRVPVSHSIIPQTPGGGDVMEFDRPLSISSQQGLNSLLQPNHAILSQLRKHGLSNRYTMSKAAQDSVDASSSSTRTFSMSRVMQENGPADPLTGALFFSYDHPPHHNCAPDSDVSSSCVISGPASVGTCCEPASSTCLPLIPQLMPPPPPEPWDNDVMMGGGMNRRNNISDRRVESSLAFLEEYAAESGVRRQNQNNLSAPEDNNINEYLDLFFTDSSGANLVSPEDESSRYRILSQSSVDSNCNYSGPVVKRVKREKSDSPPETNDERPPETPCDVNPHVNHDSHPVPQN